MAVQGFIRGDTATALSGLRSETVQAVITSPPYWGHRDYGTGTWEGGDLACPHKRDQVPNMKQATSGGSLRDKPTKECSHCGARRIDHQYGLEADPREWIDHLVGVCRGLWRVLRPDGVLWLNVGDAYFDGGKGVRHGRGDGVYLEKQLSNQAHWNSMKDGRWLQPKQLLMLPARLAIALQDDGWILRY